MIGSTLPALHGMATARGLITLRMGAAPDHHDDGYNLKPWDVNFKLK